MRHRNKINSLGRKAAHRKKTMSSLATALILNKRINTTIAKAKALRSYVEPLITRSKEDSTHSRRVVFAHLRNKYAVSELFREISQKIADRPGGYTRILKTGFRKGDGAEMCFIELVDYNTNMLITEEDTQQKRTRRSRRRGKKADDQKETPIADTPIAETPAADKFETDTELTDTEEKPDAVVAETLETAPEVTDEVKPEVDTQDVADTEGADTQSAGTKIADTAGAEDEDTPATKEHTQVSDLEKQQPVAEQETQSSESDAEQEAPVVGDEAEKPSDEAGKPSDEAETTGDDDKKPEDK